jgi:hypothetical protein
MDKISRKTSLNRPIIRSFSKKSYFVTALALAVGISAFTTRTAPYSFHLDVSGAVTGSVGQLSDGQNRVGGRLFPAQYCIADRGITDANGRGCILTRTFTFDL